MRTPPSVGELIPIVIFITSLGEGTVMFTASCNYSKPGKTLGSRTPAITLVSFTTETGKIGASTTVARLAQVFHSSGSGTRRQAGTSATTLSARCSILTLCPHARSVSSVAAVLPPSAVFFLLLGGFAGSAGR